jgi:ribosomal protein S18 acetylase RimI-like enzyme
VSADDALGRLLDWDSQFWGFRIALVENGSESGLSALDAWATNHDVDCVYLRLDAGDFPIIHLAEEVGFQLMDIRMDFARILSAIPETQDVAILHARVDDVPELVAMARDAHTDSRFFADPRFPDSKCREFYATWIANSVSGFADAVLVATVQDSVAGYITGHFEHETGRIGLIAVADQFQNRRVGSTLTSSMLSLFAKAGLSSAHVATQGSNRKAQRLYQRRGFSIDDVQLTFHRWFSHE